MRFSGLNSVALVVCLALLGALLGCGEAEREANLATYNQILNKIEAKGVVATKYLDGVWQLSRESFLYRDHINPKFNGANGRDYTDSGKFLIIHGNKIAKFNLRMSCPPPVDNVNAEWMINLVFEKGKPATDGVLNIEDLIQHSMDEHPEKWDDFSLNGQSITVKTIMPMKIREDGKYGKKGEMVTRPVLNVIRSKGDRNNAPPMSYAMHITQLDEKWLEIAYTHPGPDPDANVTDPIKGGVHAVVEDYNPVTAAELRVLLRKSFELKACQ